MHVNKDPQESLMSRSGKIRGRGLRLVLIVLVAILSYKKIGVCQDRITSVSNAPTMQGSVTPQEIAKSSVRNPQTDLVIGEGDLLQISLYGVPDFNQHVRVGASGEVSLPMIGDVKVLGLSTKQAEQIMEKNLKERGYYNNPQVTVLQQEFGSQGISVLGEVTRPVRYP